MVEDNTAPAVGSLVRTRVGDALTCTKVYAVKRWPCQCDSPQGSDHVGFDRLGHIVPVHKSVSAMCRRCQGRCEKNS